MSSLESSLARIGRDLDDLRRPWALVGALAVAALAEARSTLDVDVAIAVEGPPDAAAVVAELRRRGYRWQADFGTAMTSFEVPGLPAPGLRLDVLFGLSGIEAEVARGAQRLAVVSGVELPVAQRGDLIALKLLAAGAPGREHDWRDLRALIEGATAGDLERARASIQLLVVRAVPGAEGLASELARLLASPG